VCGAWGPRMPYRGGVLWGHNTCRECGDEGTGAWGVPQLRKGLFSVVQNDGWLSDRQSVTPRSQFAEGG